MGIRKSNLGYTLIELMITIAVMSLITGFSINAYYWLKQSDVKNASKNITTLISYTRTSTMSVKADWEMKIYKHGKKYYCSVMKMVDDPSEPTGKKEIKVKEEDLGSRLTIYKITSTDSQVEIKEDATSHASLKFNMSTGGVASGDAGYRIEVGDRTATIKLVHLTGAYYME